MKRIYKLAANFNTVEFEITDDDILDEIKPEELEYDDDDEVVFTDEAKENALKRILQHDYDILASLKVVNIAPAPKVVADAPSEKQCEWARALGMKNPEKKTKKEVWRYIQSHKDNED